MGRRYQGDAQLRALDNCYRGSRKFRGVRRLSGRIGDALQELVGARGVEKRGGSDINALEIQSAVSHSAWLSQRGWLSSRVAVIVEERRR